MKHARVLIVDGDRHLRTQLYSRLLDVDVFSDSVSEGEDAIENLLDRRYGLILLDLDLPSHAAARVIDFVRSTPSSERPILLATAARESAPTLDPELVQIVIRKPLRLSEVAEMIRSCVYGAQSGGNSMPGGAQRGHRPVQRFSL